MSTYCLLILFSLSHIIRALAVFMCSVATCMDYRRLIADLDEVGLKVTSKLSVMHVSIQHFFFKVINRISSNCCGDHVVIYTWDMWYVCHGAFISSLQIAHVFVFGTLEGRDTF